MGADVTVQAACGLAALTNQELQRVFFSSDGSSAIEVALKIAFQYWQQCEPAQPQRTKFFALDAAYHGDTLGAASVCGIDRYAALFRPLLFDVIRGPMPDDRVGTAADFLTPLAKLFAEHGDELAAVVVEPLVQCAAGFAMQPPGFLRGLRELATKYGASSSPMKSPSASAAPAPCSPANKKACCQTSSASAKASPPVTCHSPRRW